MSMTPAEKLAFLRERHDELARTAAQYREDADALDVEAEALAYAIDVIAQSIAHEAMGVAVMSDARQATALVCAPKLSEKHKRILGALRDVARDGLAEASYRDLSHAASLPIASIRAGLSHLILTGFIGLVRRGRGEGPSRYRLLVRGFGEPVAKARAA